MNEKCLATLALGLALSVPWAGGGNAQKTQPSAVACDNYARNYANNASRQGQVVGRAAAGGLVGLGLGAIAGASGVGAAVGATVGAIGGGARRQQTANRMYEVAYQDCMAGRI